MAELDVRALVLGLERYQVNYILFGTLGAIAYGAELETRDMDMCPATDQANLAGLLSLLLEWEERFRGAPDYGGNLGECRAWALDTLVADQMDTVFKTPYGPLDVVPSPYGPHGAEDRFTYDQLNARAVTMLTFECPVRVAGVDDLVASKMSRRRAKDLRVEDELRRVQRLVALGEWQPGLERYAARTSA